MLSVIMLSVVMVLVIVLNVVAPRDTHFLALNVRFGWDYLEMANALAYRRFEYAVRVKSFIANASWIWMCQSLHIFL